MGKYLDKFKNKVKQLDEKASKLETKNLEGLSPQQKELQKEMSADPWSDFQEGDMFNDLNFNDGYNDVNITPSQKPESFHHFILENQYKDLERSIRGFKDVYNKENQTWEIKRKSEHCFTDEEAEEILRTAQSHLATDIKLSFISKESFPLLMDAIYKQLSFLFRSIAEYRYGRYGSFEKQYEMKVENLKIFLELITRVQANYSRAIQGVENKNTHQSVKTQESLQGDKFNNFGMNHMGRYS